MSIISLFTMSMRDSGRMQNSLHTNFESMAVHVFPTFTMDDFDGHDSGRKNYDKEEVRQDPFLCKSTGSCPTNGEDVGE
jgi:hypothetical protein